MLVQNVNKPNLKRQPLIAVQRDNIEHEKKVQQRPLTQPQFQQGYNFI